MGKFISEIVSNFKTASAVNKKISLPTRKVSAVSGFLI